MREDWEECCFEDLLDYEQPTNYIVKSTEYNDAYETPVLTAGKSFIKGYTNETEGIFDNLPTIIFDDFTTASQFVNFKFKVKSSAMKILVPTSELVNMDFAFYAMQVNQIRSDTHKRYWISVYAKKKFLLPPLLEQKAIVAKIEELFSDLDKGIADLKKAQDQLKVYRQAVLKKAFEGELTREWREQQTDLPTADELLEQIKEERQKHYEQQIENWKQEVKAWEENGKEGKKPGKPKKIKLIEAWSENEEKSLLKIAREWKWIRLVETVFDTNDDIVDGPFGSNLKNSDFSEDGTVPVIGISNIEEGFKTKIRYVTQEKFLTISRSAVYPGNIIVAKIGSSYGKTGIYPEWMPVGLIPANLLRIRPSKHYNRSLLVLYLKSLIFKRKLDKIMKSTAQPAYNVSAFKSLPVPFMSNQEQHQIVQEIESRLSVCDKVEESITESLEKAKALRQSILKKAFEGTLLSEEEIAACKAAPDYEPASVLLEKIKAEKKKK